MLAQLDSDPCEEQHSKPASRQPQSVLQRCVTLRGHQGILKTGPEREETLRDKYGDLQEFTLWGQDHLSFREQPFCCAQHQLHGFRMVWCLGHECDLG